MKSANPNGWREVQGPHQEQRPQLGDAAAAAVAAAVAAVPLLNRIG